MKQISVGLHKNEILKPKQRMNFDIDIRKIKWNEQLMDIEIPPGLYAIDLFIEGHVKTERELELHYSQTKPIFFRVI